MTLVEFIAPLYKKTHQDRILAVLYYRERYEQKVGLTVEEIRKGLQSVRAKGWKRVNVADVLNKCGALADTGGLQGKKRLWNLTDSGRDRVRELLGLQKTDAEVEHDVGTLETLVTKLSDVDVRNYVAEAVTCLKVGALRACVVFLWTGAIRTIQAELLAKGAPAATAALQKHDPKARPIKTIDDFAYIKDTTTLLAAKEVGILDKGEKDTLEENLNLRNRCGHPGKYQAGVKKVSSFVEDVTKIVF